MSAANLTLKESIEQANNSQNEEINESNRSNDANEDGKSDESTETIDEPKGDKPDGKSTESRTSEEFVPDQEIENALQLYRILNDPTQSPQLIRELAERSGLLQKDQQISKATERSIAQIVKETLGEEYSDLHDKLTPLFEAVQNKHNDELAKLRNELAEKELAKARESFSIQFDEFLTENKITEEQAALMLAEIDIMPPNPNAKVKVPLKTYLSKIHKLIDQKNLINKEAVKRAQKIEANASERPSRLSSDVNDNRLKRGSSLPSLKESIAAAERGERFED